MNYLHGQVYHVYYCVKSFHLNTAELRDPVFYIYIKNKLCILKALLLSPNIF